VDLQRPEAVALVRQRLGKRREVAPAVRGQEPADVLDYDGARAAAFRRQALDQPPEAEEGAGAPARQARPGAGQAEVLAGGRGPGEVRRARQVGWRQRPDIPLPEV